MIQWQVNILETAPNNLARSMVRGYMNTTDIAVSLDNVFMCINTLMLSRNIGGDLDLPLPNDDTPMIWVDVMTDEELHATREWLIMLASYE